MCHDLIRHWNEDPHQCAQYMSSTFHIGPISLNYRNPHPVDKNCWEKTNLRPRHVPKFGTKMNSESQSKIWDEGYFDRTRNDKQNYQLLAQS